MSNFLSNLMNNSSDLLQNKDTADYKVFFQDKLINVSKEVDLRDFTKLCMVQSCKPFRYQMISYHLLFQLL